MRFPHPSRLALVLVLGLAPAFLRGAVGDAQQARDTASRGRSIPLQAKVNGLELDGTLSYNYVYNGNSGTLEMTAESVRNTRPSGVSGTLQLRLWATTTRPVFGQTITAFVLGAYTLGQLNAGSSFNNIDSGTIGFTPPPPGTYYITMALMEYDGSSYAYQDFFTFTELRTFGASSPCTATATSLCLNNGRFRVTTSWQTATGSGVGNAVSLTGDTGYFWFFSSSNVEMVVKVVNGCGFNSRYWAFAGGLTNVSVLMQVTDTQTGQVRNYQNPINTPFAPIQDTSAFATCP